MQNKVIEAIISLDIEILKYLQTLTGNPLIDGFMVFMSKCGDNGILWIMISLLLLTSKKYRKAGIMALAALVLSTLIGELILKHFFERQRPFVDHEIFKALVETTSVYSFPSGHAASSFAVAGSLAWFFKKISPLLLAVAALISFSRIYLFVHYPSDIVAGMILGLVCAAMALGLYKKYGNRLDRLK